jgi:NAD(P)-dependent dehydrogenase (short-subunit alcohol dehydrogenase family)
MRLEGKVALVTGAGEGFGRAIALRFAQEGADLALVDANQAAADATAAQAQASGRRALALAADVTRKADVDAAVERAAAEFGRIDVLVNATGESHNQEFLNFKEADFDRCIAISLKAYFLTCQAAGRQMAKQRSGKIVNLTSIVGKIGSGESVSWSAARGGVDAMTRTMAQILGMYGINVNALAHGASTRFNYLPEEGAERLRRLPFGRMGTDDDVTGAAVFLASDDAAFVNGDVLYVDGGYTTAAVTDDRYRPEWARVQQS